MTKPSSEAAASAAPPSRIIAAEALRGVTPFGLSELQAPGAAPIRKLTSRDLSNETARAAFELGRRRGYEHGLRAGVEQGRQQAAQALQEEEDARGARCAASLQQVAEAFRLQLAAVERELADDVLTLALDIARQVLRREAQRDPALLLPAVREALRALAEGASQITLHLHPDDASALAPHLDGLAATPCKLQPDAALPRGSCRVEADTGVIDAGFAARWQAVLDTLGRGAEAAP